MRLGAASPVWQVDNVADPRSVARRAMLLQAFVEPWGRGGGATLDDALKDAPHASVPPGARTFRVDVLNTGKTFSNARKLDIITRVVRETRALDNLAVSLENPDVVFAVLFVDSSMLVLHKTPILPKDEKYMPKRARRRFERERAAAAIADGRPPTPPPAAPPAVEHWLLGTIVASSRRSEHVNAVLPVSKRRYIANTSMNAEMACIMSNLGGVKPGSLVFDPYVGTASILLSASLHGAHTLGMDIDGRVLRGSGKVWAPPEAYDALSTKERACGRSKGFGEAAEDKARLERQRAEVAAAPDAKVAVSPWVNFRDTSLTPPIGLLQGDATRLPFRDGVAGMLDAIVTDPPYGVRERSRKVEFKPIDRTMYAEHSLSTARCEVDEAFEHLLWNAAWLLRTGGRLVCFLPVQREDHKPSEDTPSHACLTLLHDCEDVLQSKFARRLLVYAKARDPSAPEFASWLSRRLTFARPAPAARAD